LRPQPKNKHATLQIHLTDVFHSRAPNSSHRIILM
jgi:hypothetical protein